MVAYPIQLFRLSVVALPQDVNTQQINVAQSIPILLTQEMVTCTDASFP